MVFGISLSTYTTAHVIISLVAIVAGLVVVAGMLQDKRPDAWTSLFLWTTGLTSVTGFGFPFERLLPVALHRLHLAGGASDRHLGPL